MPRITDTAPAAPIGAKQATTSDNAAIDVPPLARLVPALLTMAREAGARILAAQAEMQVHHKADNTPVTNADMLAHAHITRALAHITPTVPILSEESEDSARTAIDPAQDFWLVDPLDGTKSFIRGEPSYTVNIAYIHKQRAVLGVMHVPAEDALYWGLPEADTHAWRQIGHGDAQPITVRTPPKEGWTALVSSHHSSPRLQETLSAWPIASRLPLASALKFCRIAEGAADFYPRLGPTMEWDTAAGHAIVEAAGGRMHTLEGAPMLYGKPEFRNGGFLVHGTPAACP